MFDPLSFLGFHTDISLVALVAGLVVVIGMLGSRRLPFWTGLFLLTAVLTDMTGYGFKTDHILPSHIVGAISLIVLLVAILALYVFRLAGVWRWLYVMGAVVAEFFLVFVAIAQAFAKVPPLYELAPTQSEPPFTIAQAVNLSIFVILAFWAVRSFRPRHDHHQ